jgi:superfamily II DNA/RNA helicase
MGIDVAHVRYVVHWSLPQSIEAFYQESGRAGRDGEPAHSLLYASHDDIRTLRYIVSQQEDRRRAKQQEEQQQKQQEQLLLHQKKITALEKMIEYAMTPHCRRRYLLRHFGVEDLERGRGSGRGGIDENNADGNGSNQCQARCDYCSRPDRVRRAVERSATAAAMQQSYNPFRVGSGRGYQRDDSGRIGRWGQRDAGADEHNDRDEDKREPDWDRPETEKRTRAGGLRITSSASDDGYDDETLAEAAQAATIGKQGDSHVRATLEKYEVGFVSAPNRE